MAWEGFGSPDDTLVHKNAIALLRYPSGFTIVINCENTCIET